MTFAMLQGQNAPHDEVSRGRLHAGRGVIHAGPRVGD